MALTRAGFFSAPLLRRRESGSVQAVTDALLYVRDQSDDSLVTLYTDEDKTGTVDNPTEPTPHGNIEIYADPGVYTLEIEIEGETVYTDEIGVPVAAADLADTEDAAEASAAAAAASATAAAASADEAETSATAADGSATAAAASEAIVVGAAADAATSAGEAADSATAAAGSATAAATSETNAGASETAAAGSAVAAASSATDAQTAETNAETAETNAAGSASAASTSASNAAASESAAQTAASDAATSESNAASSAASAAGHASDASGSATAAAGSASAASTSELNAASSEANAAASAAAAQTAETNAETAQAAAEQAALDAGLKWGGDWIAQAYDPMTAVRYNGPLYLTTGGATAGDEPGVDAAWEVFLAAPQFEDAGLGDLTDVSTVGQSAGEVLKTDGTNWTPGTLTAGDVGADPAGTAATAAGAVGAELDAHEADVANPHGVTAAQAGADPAGTAAAAVTAHEGASPAHAGSDITFDDTGLTEVTGATVQAALEAADAALVSATSVPDPSGEADGRILEVSTGALAYADPSSGGPTEIFLGAGMMYGTLAERGSTYGFVYQTLPPAVFSSVTGAVTPIPSDWSTIGIEAWWVAETSDAGDVVLYSRRGRDGPGDSIGSGFTATPDAVDSTPLSALTIKATVLSTDSPVPTSSQMYAVQIARPGDDALDTYAQDVRLIGVRLYKTS